MLSQALKEGIYLTPRGMDLSLGRNGLAQDTTIGGDHSCPSVVATGFDAQDQFGPHTNRSLVLRTVTPQFSQASATAWIAGQLGTLAVASAMRQPLGVPSELHDTVFWQYQTLDEI